MIRRILRGPASYALAYFVVLELMLVAADRPEGRLIAVVGDAELDEGNIFEALLESWKHDIRNVWWIIDYNRQSLDSVVSDRLFGRIDEVFQATGWNVVTLKYGTRLQAAFQRPGGDALRHWIDDCPNSLYSALTFKGGASWRQHLKRDLKGVRGIKSLLDDHDDPALHALMTNLAGHDMASVIAGLEGIADDRPQCIIAYTIKGFGLPFAGHKDNHAGIMNPDQMAAFKRANRIADGAEWEPLAGLELPAETLRRFIDRAPFNQDRGRRLKPPPVPLPADLPRPKGDTMSTQEGFGRILAEIGRRDDALARHIVTTSPDVTVSTNLGGWVNRRGLFGREAQGDTFQQENVVSAQRWAQSPTGQHIELGIAENNLFLLLAALGLSGPLFGARLLPIGTLYDPFIQRGLDALNYACYQGARFIVVATPSGISLAPEGGAHQSIGTPLIGLAQDGIAAFEPAFVDELTAILHWSFDYIQRDAVATQSDWLHEVEGGSVYLRLSTLALAQPERAMTPALRQAVIDGGYWIIPPGQGAELAVIYCGAVAGQALQAHAQILEDVPGAGLLAVTSADRLNAGWQAALKARQMGRPPRAAAIENLLRPLAPGAGLVTVIDGHPATLGWLGSVHGHRVQALGVEHFGQSGDIPDLYHHHRIDTDAILDAAAAALLRR